jgi:hypothetical protein
MGQARSRTTTGRYRMIIAETFVILICIAFGIFVGAMIFIPLKCTKKTPVVDGYVVVRKEEKDGI